MSQGRPSTMPAAPVVAGFASAGAGVVWYNALMHGLWTAATLGPICGHVGLFVVHCPSCYAALALIGGGLAAASAGLGHGCAACKPAAARTRSR